MRFSLRSMRFSAFVRADDGAPFGINVGSFAVDAGSSVGASPIIRNFGRGASETSVCKETASTVLSVCAAACKRRVDCLTMLTPANSVTKASRARVEQEQVRRYIPIQVRSLVMETEREEITGHARM